MDLDAWWERFIAARLDTAEGTRANYRKAAARFSPLLGSRDPFALTIADIQEAVGVLANEIGATTLHKYANSLQQVLDFAGVEPNVARDRRVKLPSAVREEPEPPDAPFVVAMLGKLTKRWLLAFVTTDQTGMRVGEIASSLLEGRGRRRLAVPDPGTRDENTQGEMGAGTGWLMDETAASCPMEDRLPDRPVFPRVSEDGLRNAVLRACRSAGIPTYSPHDLRHRRITIWHHAGMPTKEIQGRVGHSRASMTLDTYAHVMPVQEVPADTFLAAWSCA